MNWTLIRECQLALENGERPRKVLERAYRGGFDNGLSLGLCIVLGLVMLVMVLL